MKYIYLAFLLLATYITQANIKADFKASKTIAFIDEEIFFENLSQGDSLQFKWDFGDFSAGFEKSPIHSFILEGTFDIKLIAYNKHEADTLIKIGYIKIHPVLKADFNYNVKGATDGYSVSCYNTSKGNIKNYEWDFYNGTVSHEQNPTITYDEPGNYNISLKVTDGVFTDSIFFNDVVEIRHPNINIEKYNREQFYYDLGTNESIGGKTITNGYIIGTQGNLFQKIIRFNLNKKISWIKEYDSKYYYSILFDVDDYDNTWIALNSDQYYKSIEVVDFRGDLLFRISDPFNLIQNGDYEIMDNKVISTGNAIIANFGKEAVLKIFDSEGNEFFSDKITDDDCLVDDYIIDVIKITEAYNGDLYIFTRKQLTESEEYKYFYTQFIKTENSYECANLSNGNCICNEIPEINFEENAEFRVYNDNSLLMIQGRKVFNIKNFKSETPEYFNYSNLVHTKIYGIDIINEDKFAVAGKFNGFMKLSIVNLEEDIVVDYVSNRLGYFRSVEYTDDGNLVLTGTLKKNYRENAMYYLNVPYDLFLGVDDEITKNSFILSPNPANNFIYISSEIYNDIALSQKQELQIFNVFGETMKHFKIIHSSDKIRIDISEFTKGIYFIKIGNITEKFIKL